MSNQPDKIKFNLSEILDLRQEMIKVRKEKPSLNASLERLDIYLLLISEAFEGFDYEERVIKLPSSMQTNLREAGIFFSTYRIVLKIKEREFVSEIQSYASAEVLANKFSDPSLVRIEVRDNDEWRVV